MSKPNSDDVFLSVLALDSYMRGSFRAIEGIGSAVGTATVKDLQGETLGRGGTPSIHIPRRVTALAVHR